MVGGGASSLELIPQKRGCQGGVLQKKSQEWICFGETLACPSSLPSVITPVSWTQGNEASWPVWSSLLVSTQQDSLGLVRECGLAGLSPLSPSSSDPFGLNPLIERSSPPNKGQSILLVSLPISTSGGSRKGSLVDRASRCESFASIGSFFIKRIEHSRWFQSRSRFGGSVGLNPSCSLLRSVARALSEDMHQLLSRSCSASNSSLGGPRASDILVALDSITSSARKSSIALILKGGGSDDGMDCSGANRPLALMYVPKVEKSILSKLNGSDSNLRALACYAEVSPGLVDVLEGTTDLELGHRCGRLDNPSLRISSSKDGLVSASSRSTQDSPGLAGTHSSWGLQIKYLTSTEIPTYGNFNNPCEEIAGDDNEGMEICAFDNRGMGRSSVPIKKSEYTTTIMAKDAIALMDHLGWRKAHVFGHSMGAMIACKLAAIVPDRILSLALLNVTGGGFECFPKFDCQSISIAIRFLRAKTPEQRAAVDLDTHYTKDYLEEYIGPNTRRTILYQEYVKCISSTGMQSNYGFQGQANACWTHKMTRTEIEVIRSAGFLISFIHGRHDIIAQIHYAKKLAEKLQPSARMVDLHGGHLVSHERPEEVNQALLELIKASEMKLSPHDWSNLPQKGWQEMGKQMSLNRRNTEGENCLSLMFDMLLKLQLSLSCFYDIFVMAFDYGSKVFGSLKPVRVGSSLS
ncbi:hypothetical protein HHK36_001311 [Tetracentron sinense]|uniref:AB hydrolase-1 domain-containing protein n=1 Tax=Tetracentron sinense TaxID=13715 RepID=A0A835A3F7_TETSI|nr:hypothetical protein HHK36_001311 [Tetracentron sinense]